MLIAFQKCVIAEIVIIIIKTVIHRVSIIEFNSLSLTSPAWTEATGLLDPHTRHCHL